MSIYYKNNILGMDKQLRDALQERVSLGKSKSEIVNELIESGYGTDESVRLYEMVTGNSDKASVTAPRWSSNRSTTTPSTRASQAASQSNQTVNPKPSETESQPQATNRQSSSSDTVKSETQPQSIATSGSVDKTASTSSAAIPETNNTIAASHDSHLGFIVGVVISLLLATLLVVAIMLGWHRPLLSSLGLGGAPYDEVTLFPGIAEDIMAIREGRGFFQLESNFALYVEEPDESIEAGPDEFFEIMGVFLRLIGMGVPDEAHIKSNIVTRFDGRNADDLRFDVQADSDLLLEPVALRLGGSFRLAENTLYGRIDRIPPLLAATFEADGLTLPEGEWIVMPSFDELSEMGLTAPFSPPTFPSPMETDDLPVPHMNEQPHLFLQPFEKFLASGVAGSLWTSVNEFVSLVGTETIDTSTLSMTANVGEALFREMELDLDENELQQAEMVLDAYHTAWQQYPLTKFKKAPYQTTDNGESVYVYHVAIDIDHIEPFLRSLLRDIEDDTITINEINFDVAVIEYFIENELAEVKAFLQQFDRYYDLRIHVRPDGSLQGVLMNAGIRSEVADVPIQLRFELHHRHRQQDTIDSIEVPTDVYERTYLEVFEASLGGSMQQAQDEGNPNDVIAVVNGEELIRAEFNAIRQQALQTAQQQGMNLNDSETMAQVYAQATDTLVNTELIRQAAMDAGITASDEEVQDRFDEIVKQVGGEEMLDGSLQQLGLTEDLLRSNIEQELVIQRYLESSIDSDSLTATDAEINELAELLRAEADIELMF